MEETTKKVVVETLKAKLNYRKGIEVITNGNDIIVRSDSKNIASCAWVTPVVIVSETFGLAYYISTSIVNGMYEARIYEF